MQLDRPVAALPSLSFTGTDAIHVEVDMRGRGLPIRSDNPILGDYTIAVARQEVNECRECTHARDVVIESLTPR